MLIVRCNWKMNFTFYGLLFTDPLRNFQYFPMALLIRSIVHLFSRCIINLYVSILCLFVKVSKRFQVLRRIESSKCSLEFPLQKLTASINFLIAVRWLEIFPREQLLLVNGDQLIEDPLTQIRRIEDFLGGL